MSKFFLIFFFVFSSFLTASKIEVYANNLESDADKTSAWGDIRLIQNNTTIRADNIVIDRNSDCIEVYGNISVFQNNNDFAMTDYVFIDLKNNYSILDKFFYMNKKDMLWISSKEAKKEKSIYTIKKASTSTCNPSSPDWTISFSTGVFNENDEWIDLYNPVIYAGEVPVFYLPYLGFPTSTKRRSGLLKLTFGNSEKEGVILKQPIYFAPHEWWDATITPEIRTNRGDGFVGELRIADSLHSKGSIEFGEFFDYKEYTKKEALQNKTHYGFNINYQRDTLFSDYANYSKDGLYLDFTKVNDVDYLSLQDKQATKIITSTFNYLFYTPKNYIGLNAKYFTDTTKPNNDETLQIMPQLQFHRATESLFFDNLTYSFDYKFKNYDREVGLKAKDSSFSIPLAYSFSIFDDYLNFLIKENFYYYRIDYSNSDDSALQNDFKEYGNIFETSHFASIFTDLSKEYNDFFHNINLSLNYFKISDSSKNGYFDKNIYTTTQEVDKASLKFSQFLLNNGESLITHRANQTYFINENNITIADFENEIIFKPNSQISFESLIYTSNDYGKISKAIHAFKYTNPNFLFSMHNIYEKDLKNDKKTVDYDLYKTQISPFYRHKLSAHYSHDNIMQESREYGVEYIYNKRCWDFSLSFNRELRPSLVDGEINSKINDIIYLKINLNPFFGFEQKVYEYEYERDG